MENSVHILYKGGITVDDMEQKVWQRVMQPGQQTQTDLKPLAMESQGAMAEYRQLLKSRVESIRELGRQLVKTEQENLASLRGLHYLQTGEPMKLPMVSA